MTRKEQREEIRRALEGVGLGGVDELTLERLVRAQDAGGPPGQQMRALLEAFGVRDLDTRSVDRLVELADDAHESEALADAIFIGECPCCGSEETRNCTEVAGIEDPTVGFCSDRSALWCSECGTRLSRQAPACGNPDCWLNQPGLGDGGR